MKTAHHIATVATLSAASLILGAAGAHAERPAGNELIVALTSFTPGATSTFTSVLPGCESGVVTNQGDHVQLPPPHGVYNGFKVFTCDGGAGGFTIHLSSAFGGEGSTGSWALTEAWGSQAGLHGSGVCVGTPFDGGITDSYQGSLLP